MACDRSAVQSCVIFRVARRRVEPVASEESFDMLDGVLCVSREAVYLFTIHLARPPLSPAAPFLSVGRGEPQHVRCEAGLAPPPRPLYSSLERGEW